MLPPPTDDDPATGLRVSVVPADYDGDGDTDPAYYTSDTGTWYIEGEDPIAFGRRTDDPSAPAVDGPPFPDIPVPADYDGDGDADLAVYRVETGEFLVQGQGTIPTGIAYGQPVPADYTPEPGAEAAVMGMYGEGWAVEGEPAPRPYPITTTVVFAVPADYDGDGTAELVRRSRTRRHPTSGGSTACRPCPSPSGTALRRSRRCSRWHVAPTSCSWCSRPRPASPRGTPGARDPPPSPRRRRHRDAAPRRVRDPLRLRR